VRRRYSLVTWFFATGGWALVGLAVLFLVHIRRQADQERRAALDEGWVVEPETEPGPELDPTQDR